MRRPVARLLACGATLVPLIAGLLFFTAIVREAASAPPTTSSIRGKCGLCHKEIAQEWLNSPHAKAFQDPHFVDEVKNEKEAESKCFGCHAPEVLRAKGLGQTPAVRADVRDVGVDCLVCHVNTQQKISAPAKSGAAPHEVLADPQHRTEVLCASCHGPYGTVDEFKATSFAKQGQTCITCHMPKSQKPIAVGGKPKMVASHAWKGSGDPEMMKKAVKMDATVDADGVVTVKIANVGAGHKFPTGIQYHQALLVVAVTDASGKEVFSKQELFADQTKSGGTDTRINAGETRAITVPTGVKSGNFTVQLLHRPVPEVADKDATVVATFTAKQ